jgi:hypothetical protein
VSTTNKQGALCVASSCPVFIDMPVTKTGSGSKFVFVTSSSGWFVFVLRHKKGRTHVTKERRGQATLFCDGPSFQHHEFLTDHTHDPLQKWACAGVHKL